MKGLRINQHFRSRYFLAAIAGLLWTAAFPNIGMAGLGWIAPGLLAASALGKRPGESFRIGYVGGLVHYLTMLYWLLLIPYRWYGIPVAPATGWIALSGFLALAPAAWVWLINSVPLARSKPEGATTGSQVTGEGLLHTGVLSPSWLRRTIWALTGAAAWVASEMYLSRIFGGFPWDLLGVSQYPMVPLIQFASVTGVYGISFLLVWSSLSLLSGGIALIRRPTVRSVWIGEVFVPLLVVAVLFNIGLRYLHRETAPERTLKLMLMQPSIPQTVIWDAAEDARRFDHLVQWSDQVLTTNRADVLIWPESAVPKMVRYDTNTFNAITNLALRHHVWMIVGSDDAEPKAGAANPDEADYFNSSFLVSPEGELRQRYIKRNLVIFGEYLPLQHWLPFLRVFTPITGGFTPGTHPVQFNLAALDVKTSVLICFEDAFPQLAQGDVDPGTDFLVNITNDGWFGESAEQWQHAVTAVFRAVENRLPLVRCTNNGLTCWVDANGRIRDIFRDDRGTIYGPGFMTVEIPLAGKNALHQLTLYTRYGDWFGWGCVAVAGAVLLRKLIPGFGLLKSRHAS